MENFVVSARKYRPITFDAVVGQSHITTTLKNAIRTNHLAQAFLFCGPRGVGKTTCARILAKTINCKNLDDSIEPCNECSSCKSFGQNASFNIHELDAASNNSVEDIRNLIDQVRFPPQDGKYKVYIIDEVHMLSQAAFNAFLKTLEEPPKYAIFILATTEKHKILPTILSRCQIFDFNRIQIKDMADHLAAIAQKENVEAEYSALELIAQKADGGLRDALSMFDLNVTFSAGNAITYQAVLNNLHILDYDYYFKMTDALMNGHLTDALLIYNEILQKGFDGHQFVVGLNEHFRNLLVAKDPKTVRLMEVSESVKQRYISQAIAIDTGFLLSSLSVGSSIDANFKTAKNQRLHVEIGLMKLAQINRVLQLAQLPEGGLAEKKNLIETPQSPQAPVLQPTPPSPQPLQSQTQEPVKSYVTTRTTTPSGAMKGSSLRSTSNLETPLISDSNLNQTTTHTSAEFTQKNQPFTQDSLKIAILNFAQSLESDTARLMLKKDFLLENNSLTFVLDNVIQLENFNNLKQDLAAFVRREICNSTIQFQAKVNTVQSVRKAYTAQEKYDEMIQKNPTLTELRRALDLDLLY